jgi:hypothetical protein
MRWGIDGSAVTKRVKAARMRGGESMEMKRLRKALKRKNS